MDSLQEIYSKYKRYCDKGDRSDIGMYGHFYIEKYEKHLSEMRLFAKNVLEIGTMSGASALMLDEYFPNAHIYTLDRDLPSDNSRWPDFFPPVNMEFVKRIESSSKITFLHCDAYKKKALKKIKNIDFDVVIDDGFHSFETMKFFIINYFKLLKKDGIGIIEDIGLDGVATLENLESLIRKENLSGDVIKYDFDNDDSKKVSRASNLKPHDKMLIYINN